MTMASNSYAHRDLCKNITLYCMNIAMKAERPFNKIYIPFHCEELQFTRYIAKYIVFAFTD